MVQLTYLEIIILEHFHMFQEVKLLKEMANVS